MCRSLKLSAIALVVAVLVAATFLLGARFPLGVETDLWAMVDISQSREIAPIVRAISQRAWVLFSGNDEHALHALAQRVAQDLKQPPAPDFSKTLDYLVAHRSGLLAPTTRQLLQTGNSRAVTQTALSRLYAPIPALVSPRYDPFGLLSDYILSIQRPFSSEWAMLDGYPVKRLQDGQRLLLLTLDTQKLDGSTLASFCNDAQQKRWGEAIRIWCAGAPFHTARTATKAKQDINYLSLISIACVIVLGFLLFRSFAFLPKLLIVLFVSGMGASVILFLIFPRPHVLTFVFGTSLIGLCVDYVYHTLAVTQRETLQKPLTYALLTSLVAFAPILLAPSPVLRQMAFFVCTGLTLAWLCTRKCTSSHVCVWSWPVLLLVLAMCGLSRVSLCYDPHVLYTADPFLQESERQLRTLCPHLLSERFAFIRGDSLQACLECEEAAGLKGLSGTIPSLKRQRENARLIKQLYRCEGKRFTQTTGLECSPPSAETAIESFLDAERCTDPFLQKLIAFSRVPGGLIAPCPSTFTSRNPNIQCLVPYAILRDFLYRETHITVRLLLLSAILLIGLLFALLRKSVWSVILPVLMALVATIGTLGWLGIPITFFTLLAFFALIGLGLDYAIFGRTLPMPTTRRVVRYTFLTSLVGFGLLGFTHFPVTRQLGLTFAIGLTWAWFFARFTKPSSYSNPHTQEYAQDWFHQPEIGRPFLLQLLWLVYCAFGKRVIYALCMPITFCLLPWTHTARKNLRHFYALCGIRISSIALYRHLLGFAYGLIDKLDACTRKHDLPQLDIVRDEHWMAFQHCLRNRQGCFLLTSHLGTAEVLPALAQEERTFPIPIVHAFQQLNHNIHFTRLFLRHLDTSHLKLHAVETIGVETAVLLQDALARGELVLMAGDRVPASGSGTWEHDFLNQPCRWPKGVFTLAKLLAHPVFFITCIALKRNQYRVQVRQCENITDARKILSSYVTFLAFQTQAYPYAWYHFHDFFARRVP